MAYRLTSLSVHGMPGMPAVDIPLWPVTALVGPRATGKSRLLAAIAWLLTGGSPVAATLDGARVSAELVTLDDESKKRRIRRSPDEQPGVELPGLVFLSARDRFPAADLDSAGPRGDAEAAERMVAEIAERRLSGVEGEVLVIEEPELMLTPQQQRHVYRLLRRYAERNQVIYSTRAPALLDAVHYHEIVRLDRTSAGTRIRRARPEVLSDEERVRLAAQFDRERTEMFFATAVVLVEGQTERQSLPLIFERLGHDPDALGISIVEVGGKGNLGLVARVLRELHIPHLLVFDSDRGRPAATENAELRRQAGAAPVFELEPDFEGAAGIRGHDDKVYEAWRRFSEIRPEQIPDVFRRIVERTVALAESPAAPQADSATSGAVSRSTSRRGWP
jgi:predicted ATP-dependent endonuclease of OLD family